MVRLGGQVQLMDDPWRVSALYRFCVYLPHVLKSLPPGPHKPYYATGASSASRRVCVTTSLEISVTRRNFNVKALHHTAFGTIHIFIVRTGQRYQNRFYLLDKPPDTLLNLLPYIFTKAAATNSAWANFLPNVI